MRKEFSSAIERIAGADERIIFLTGDLGFRSFENVRDRIGHRFVNAGVAEQNMISVAAALAGEGCLPVCYSIAPFVVHRPNEQVRVDVCLHDLDVKIVGNGGGFTYGALGPTHHALEDLATLSCLQNMVCFVPWCNEDVPGVVDAVFRRRGPSYLRLGFGPKPAEMDIPAYAPWRLLSGGDRVTVAGLGPILLNVLKAATDDPRLQGALDVFAVSELPLARSEEFLASVRRTGRLLVVEDHVQRGGLAEAIAVRLLEEGVTARFRSLRAHGYAAGVYGSQAFHQRENGLDSLAIARAIEAILR